MPTNKPCPFCGGRRLRAIERLNYDATPSGVYAVVCDDCGAHGPGSKDEAGAKGRWAGQWASEREATVKALRNLCRDHGDNNWPDDAHLVDVIVKHVHPGEKG